MGGGVSKTKITEIRKSFFSRRFASGAMASAPATSVTAATTRDPACRGRGRDARRPTALTRQGFASAVWARGTVLRESWRFVPEPCVFLHNRFNSPAHNSSFFKYTALLSLLPKERAANLHVVFLEIH